MASKIKSNPILAHLLRNQSLRLPPNTRILIKSNTQASFPFYNIQSIKLNNHPILIELFASFTIYAHAHTRAIQ